MKKEKLKIDTSNLSEMRDLMKRHKEFDWPLEFINEDDERVLVSISEENITTRTYQKNKWIRINTYWDDGIVEEQYVDGKNPDVMIRAQYLRASLSEIVDNTLDLGTESGKTLASQAEALMNQLILPGNNNYSYLSKAEKQYEELLKQYKKINHML